MRHNKQSQRFFLSINILLFLLNVTVTIVSLFLQYKQISDLSDVKNQRHLDYMFALDKELNTGINSRIALGIGRKNPLLKENGGSFTTTDFDYLLSTYHQLNEVYDRGLISTDLVYSNFSDGLIQTYQNKEIQEYLSKIRKDDPGYFLGFDELAQEMQYYSDF